MPRPAVAGRGIRRPRPAPRTRAPVRCVDKSGRAAAPRATRPTFGGRKDFKAKLCTSTLGVVTTRPTITEPTGDTPEPTTNGPPVVHTPRPWLRTVAALPHRKAWFTGAKIALVAGTSLFGFAAGTGAHLGFAFAGAACLVTVALVDRLDTAIRDHEQRAGRTGPRGRGRRVRAAGQLHADAHRGRRRPDARHAGPATAPGAVRQRVHTRRRGALRPAVHRHPRRLLRAGRRGGHPPVRQRPHHAAGQVRAGQLRPHGRSSD